MIILEYPLNISILGHTFIFMHKIDSQNWLYSSAVMLFIFY